MTQPTGEARTSGRGSSRAKIAKIDRGDGTEYGIAPQLGAQCEVRRGQRRQECGVPERWRELGGLSFWVMEAQGEGGTVIS